MNATRRGRADRHARWSSTARTGSIFPTIVPQTSRSSAPPRPTSAATSPTSTRAAISARSTRRWPSRNNGGIVIAQVKRLAKSGTLKPHDVLVPGILVDAIVVAPDQMQTTQTVYDPAISGEMFRPLSSFEMPEFDVQKVIARRVAQELRYGDAVNLGFGISANVPRILHRGRPARRRHLGDRAGRGRRRAAARLPVRLRLERRGHRALALPVHLFPGRRLRRLAAVLPADRPGRLASTSRSSACGRM